MNKKMKFLFAFTGLAILSLSACSLFGEPKDQFLEDIKNAPVETDTDLLEEISVVNAEAGVYGNIYLPEEVDGAVITWWSSNRNVIYPSQYDDVAAGEVARPSNDVTVSLKAKIEKDGVVTKFEQDVLVKGLSYQPEDEDFEAYLFGHFIGESYGKTEGGVKIATGEQMFFALADVGEGFHFDDLNGSTMSNLKPVLSSKVGERGVRDPHITRSPEGDTFYLIATDLSVYTRGGWGSNNGAGKFTITGSHSIVLWESHDLVNWTEGRLIEVARPDAGMAWAPEMIYHEESGQYVIFFSSTILNEAKNAILERDCIYYTTTRDFTHFSETKKFLKNQPYPNGQEDPQKANDSPQAINNNERKIIDASVMKIGDYYYSAAKDGDNHEANGGILIQRTQDIFDVDSWEKVMNLQDLGYKVQNRDANNTCLEGPEWFYFNKDERQDEDIPEIGLMADYYANTSVGYIPFATTDIEDNTNASQSWRQLVSTTEYSWDAQTKRHGTVLRITAEEAERLKEAYPNT